METRTNFCITHIIDNIVFHLTGDSTHKSPPVIKINYENLLVNGELHCVCNFKAWRGLLPCSKSCTSILQHFAHTRGATKKNTDADVAEEIFKQLISKSNDWPVRIQKCLLQRERICLFLNRGDIIANSITMAVECGTTFGKAKSTTDKVFILKYQPDEQSDLTSQRLRILKDVATKMLNLHGYEVSTGEDCTAKYMFTSKSEGSIDEGYKKYVCGVVKNAQSNSKETCLTWEQYTKYKINQLAELNEHKFIENEKSNVKNVFLHNLANAIVIFELMSVKPTKPVIIESNCKDNRSMTNTRGASFALYNTARIATIIAKHRQKVLCGDYPDLPDIKNVDFSQLQDEEWELVYNFIFGYSQMINNFLTCEPNFYIYPQVLCLFLSRLCQKFSVYYRNVRILTEGGDHLIPKMTARLYMLRALQVVFENTLDILGIKPISRM